MKGGSRGRSQEPVRMERAPGAGGVSCRPPEERPSAEGACS